MLLSRHPLRPFTLDYVARFIEDFVELHGDRAFRDDESIVGGVGRFSPAGRIARCMILGHQKGRGTKENMRRNFGMTRPEGYRKALRLMETAARLGLPILTFIDTPGAYPGIDAEERGQAEAIAKNLEVMARLPVPIIATVIGEGGSGGALALGVADRILMLEYSVYSVISPEGCASILWKDQKKVETAAREMKMTAPDLLELGIADAIVQEPAGGAHRDTDAAADAVGEAIARELEAVRRAEAGPAARRALREVPPHGLVPGERPGSVAGGRRRGLDPARRLGAGAADGQRRSCAASIEGSCLISGSSPPTWRSWSTSRRRTRSASLAGKVAASLAAVLVFAPRLVDRLERDAFVARGSARRRTRATMLRELLVPGATVVASARGRSPICSRRAPAARRTVLRRLDGETRPARDDREACSHACRGASPCSSWPAAHRGVRRGRRPSSAPDWPAEHPVLGAYLVRAHAELGQLAEAHRRARRRRARAAPAPIRRRWRC